MMWGTRGLTALLLSVVVPISASAQSGLSSVIYEVRGGVLAHDLHIVAANHYEPGVSLNGEVAFAPSLPLWVGVIRPVLGGTVTTGGGTSWGYLDARWEFSGSLFFFGIGVGGSINNAPLTTYTDTQKPLGSNVLFHIPLEIGLQITPENRVSAFYEHSSNAFLASPNPGMDNLGVRFAHRF
jgi:hypothetical protein